MNRGPRRHKLEETPAWAERFLTEHTIPDKSDAVESDWIDFLEWRFFGKSVPGLPDRRTPGGQDLVNLAG